ncbi:MAG TPA: sulfurtransferase [Acidiferrobacteraceae bacterium]|nr:sulfurtransferase [Acidiferrobacteraceae bacterium]
MIMRINFLKVISLLVFVTPLTGLAAPVLVDTAWVAKHMDDPKLLLVDMAVEDTQYQRFHLSGAVYLPYAAIVYTRKDGVSVRVPDQHLIKVLGLMGITADHHVVIYDDMGGLQAGRLFWELERIGHRQVSVMDGGLVRWVLEGRKVVAAPTLPKPNQYWRTKLAGRANDAKLEEVVIARDKRTAVLLDVRSKEEYLGNENLKKHNKPSGHIPGARWWPWDQSVGFNAGFKLKDRIDLLASLAAIGVKDKSAPVITYCRSGHRAAQSYLVLRHLGFTQVSLYDGSMAEYVRDPKAVLKTGASP